MSLIKVEPLTSKAFAPFGRVLGKPSTEADSVREDLKAWIGFSDLLGLEAKNPVLAFLSVNRHDLPFNQLERHCQGAEAFIPLSGSSVLVCAPVGNPDDPDEIPDESQIKAFLIDGSAGVFLPRGSWHWAPFAVTDEATFLLLLDKDISDDIDIREIEPRALNLY